MRFINCPNCLCSHPDDEYLNNESASIGCSPLNRRKRSRLHSLTKALFSPARATFGANKSKGFVCCAPPNTTNKHLESMEPTWSSAHTKYRLERKHKVKKRDLIKQHQRRTETTGNPSHSPLLCSIFLVICHIPPKNNNKRIFHWYIWNRFDFFGIVKCDRNIEWKISNENNRNTDRYFSVQLQLFPMNNAAHVVLYYQFRV